MSEEQLQRQIFALERRVAALERLLSSTSAVLAVSSDNVADPPTDANLDSAFGTPATVGKGFTALVDDNGAETTVWLCAAIDTTWWYVGLTKAL